MKKHFKTLEKILTAKMSGKNTLQDFGGEYLQQK